MNRTSFAILPLLFSPLAYAHPGAHHGNSLDNFLGNLLDGIVHLLTEPDHLAVAAVAVLAGIAGARFFRRRRDARSQDTRR